MEESLNIEDYKDIIKKAEQALEFTFNDKSLLLKALTHPSAVQGFGKSLSYERLEFLGDSLLSTVVSVAIFNKYPDIDEGKMTHMRVALVSGENLSRIAKDIGLDELIIFGKSEQSTGKRGLKSALENVFEAIVAAVFLDAGHIKCWKFVTKFVLNSSIDNASLVYFENPKSTLQELVQVKHKTPQYCIIEESGPAHDKQFIAAVMVDDKELAKGCGRSKKEAEANAALAALSVLNGDK